jgi:hypothetical protein
LAPLGLQLLFQFFDALFSACVRNDLGIVFGLEVLRILPLLIQDVKGDLSRVGIDVSEMVN